MGDRRTLLLCDGIAKGLALDYSYAMRVQKTPYEKFMEEANARRAEASRMHAAGAKVSEIAGKLRVTQQRVYQMLGSVRRGQN